MRIYDADRMRKRTFVEQTNELFQMGQELEDKVDSIPGGGGGDATIFTMVATLSATDWVNNQQAIFNDIFTDTCNLIIGSVESNVVEYANSGVKAIAQNDGYITFSCESVPVNDLEVLILIDTSA